MLKDLSYIINAYASGFTVYCAKILPNALFVFCIKLISMEQITIKRLNVIKQNVICHLLLFSTVYNISSKIEEYYPVLVLIPKIAVEETKMHIDKLSLSKAMYGA